MTYQYVWEMSDVVEAENKGVALLKIKERLRKIVSNIGIEELENLVTIAYID